MALHEVIAVLDAAAGAYHRPIFVQSHGVGIRSFTDEVNRRGDDSPMNVHPEDFSLWSLGVYDDSSGLITPHVSPQLLIKAVDVIVRG